MREGFWTDEEQREANKHLKKVVREAKRRWADEYVADDSSLRQAID
jgi:hypothetical protein